jgi:uncharacterized hydrophobic protein (TIGR00271 family)
MLIAPLLAPVVGLALGLAVGDGRLSFHTAVVVVGSTLAVIATGAILTLLLPYHNVTEEILARTRPTTLDLGVAVLSGLAGAVVTVSRGSNLAGAVPGVAISVALVPPLAVTGFGIGIGWNSELIRGSLLLYGANLAGIVLSGTAVFLAYGMHRRSVLEAAQRWHAQRDGTLIGRLMSRAPGVRSLGVIKSPWARLSLAIAFVVILGFPLSATLAQISREARVHRAVQNAADAFRVPGRSFVLGRQLVFGPQSTQVFLRIATTEWFDTGARERFERTASAQAGEEVTVVLEQLPASIGNVEQFARLIPGASPSAAGAKTQLNDLIASVRLRLADILDRLLVPERAMLVGGEIVLGAQDSAVLRIAYTSETPLPREAEEIMAEHIVRATEGAPVEVQWLHIPSTALALRAASADSVTLQRVTQLLERYPLLDVMVSSRASDSTAAHRAQAGLLATGIDSTRVRLRVDTIPGIFLRLLRRPPPGASAVEHR